MFILRSLFWLSGVVLLLPPTADGEAPAPRLSILHTAYATQVLFQDMTGVCARNPEACAVSREALAVLSAKLERSADIVAAGIAASQSGLDPEERGTLSAADLEPAWALAEAGS